MTEMVSSICRQDNNTASLWFQNTRRAEPHPVETLRHPNALTLLKESHSKRGIQKNCRKFQTLQEESDTEIISQRNQDQKV